MSQGSEVAVQAAEKLRLWREKPQVMVRELFNATPDPWQDEDLAAFPHTQRYAAKACKGPGKSTVLSWMGWNFLLTRPHPNCAAISISADNLRDGLWKEMAKWYQRSELLKAMFEVRAERIYCRDFKDTWFMSARSWSQSANKEEQSNALAGFHADRLLYLVDESGGIPDAVMVAAEAGLASGIETKICQAGNPTHLAGPLYRASTTQRHLWNVREITADPDDPLRTPRVSMQWAREMIAEFGRDHPWVKVNVLGQFPPSSLNALLGPDDVSAAMGRHVPAAQYQKAAKALGVDVARFGDDSSVIFPRQGVVAMPPTVLRNVDSLQGAGAVMRVWNQWGADGAFVDNTGGHGAGWVDQLTVLGKAPMPIEFSGSANDPRFFNKRAEILWEMAAWVKNGGALPLVDVRGNPIEDIRGELVALEYFYKGDKIAIIEKAIIKQKIGRSPDKTDALALTFSHPLQAAWSVEREQLVLSAGDFQRAVTERSDEDRYSR